jgi:predicted DNA-binding protein
MREYTLGVRLTPTELEKLNRLAEQCQRSKSDLVRLILRQVAGIGEPALEFAPDVGEKDVSAW